eukprot:TRINITY_DN14287_c0_g2_i1.p1 TRINITY_DN14287_c0_g2~~TRINITY_DN14287_c0_g2_i1.p1  ORF type:complete len:172 (-),score=30.04 TRINITY_DN14287_c0_g2_i1:62-547(-)
MPLFGKKSQAEGEASTEKVKELMRDYESLKGGKSKRISVEVFARKVEAQSRDSQGRSITSYDSITAMFKDRDNIEFPDYLKFVLKISSEETVKRVLTDIFKEVDEGRGSITGEELRALEGRLGINLDEDEAGRIISEWDSSGEGKLDLESFLLYKTNNLNR